MNHDTLFCFLSVMNIASLLDCSPYMAGCLSATSYVTVVFYTRTFSNSLEAFFFALLLVCVCEFVQCCKASLSMQCCKAATLSTTRNAKPSTAPDGGSPNSELSPGSAASPIDGLADSNSETTSETTSEVDTNGMYLAVTSASFF